MEKEISYEYRLRQGGDFLLSESSAFFDGGGTLRRTLYKLIRRLAEEEIDYALLGGLALAEHGFPRLTQDIDLLLSPVGLERFRERLSGRGYRPAFEGARKTFRDMETHVRIEIITSGEYPGDGRPKKVLFPDPSQPDVTEEIQGVRVITLRKLIELKLASGQSAAHRRRDLADIQDLIRVRKLPLELGEQLDGSVRDFYRLLWNEVHLNDRNEMDASQES